MTSHEPWGKKSISPGMSIMAPVLRLSGNEVPVCLFGMALPRQSRTRQKFHDRGV